MELYFTACWVTSDNCRQFYQTLDVKVLCTRGEWVFAGLGHKIRSCSCSLVWLQTAHQISVWYASLKKVPKVFPVCDLRMKRCLVHRTSESRKYFHGVAHTGKRQTKTRPELGNVQFDTVCHGFQWRFQQTQKCRAETNKLQRESIPCTYVSSSRARNPFRHPALWSLFGWWDYHRESKTMMGTTQLNSTCLNIARLSSYGCPDMVHHGAVWVLQHECSSSSFFCPQQIANGSADFDSMLPDDPAEHQEDETTNIATKKL